jgi:hypothetical protein
MFNINWIDASNCEPASIKYVNKIIQLIKLKTEKENTKFKIWNFKNNIKQIHPDHINEFISLGAFIDP